MYTTRMQRLSPYLGERHDGNLSSKSFAKSPYYWRIRKRRLYNGRIVCACVFSFYLQPNETTEEEARRARFYVKNEMYNACIQKKSRFPTPYLSSECAIVYGFCFVNPAVLFIFKHARKPLVCTETWTLANYSSIRLVGNGRKRSLNDAT